jgi:hypothetical protein
MGYGPHNYSAISEIESASEFRTFQSRFDTKLHDLNQTDFALNI